MGKKVFLRIKELLEKNNIVFQTFEHEPVYTSEQAAKVREKKFGISAKKVLKRGAKAMIVQTDNTFVEIAAQLLFSNPSYFSKFFKKQTGYTPMKYRELYLNKHLTD